VKRLLELRPDIQVAAGALAVDRRCLARQHAGGSVGVHLVTRCTSDLVSGMAALQPSDMCRLIEVTAHADPVGCSGRKLRGIANIVSRCRFGVLLRRPVT